MTRRPAVALAVAPLLVGAALVVGQASDISALGRPDWAEPYLGLPRPSGSYIAANDAWAVVYGEVEFSLRGDRSIVQTCRLVLENIAAGPETLTVTLAYDEGQQDLVDISLHVQRRLWHELNLGRKAATATISGSARVLLASAEQIEPGRRAVLQYTLADRLGFNPWSVALIPGDFPIARIRYSVESQAARRGLGVVLVTSGGTPPPVGFTRDGPVAWTVEKVPAAARIVSKDSRYQPSETELFPYFLATVAGTQAATFATYGAHYRAAWDKRLATVDAAQVSAQAEALVRGQAGWRERVTSLARFVQHDVQYDGTNEKSIESWLPLSTQETLRSRKGDCKGKVMLLQALLKAIGVDAVPLLLRADTRYFSWRDEVGSAFLNHVVLAVKPPREEPPLAGTLTEPPLDGWVLIDPTVESAAFGRPMPGLEGFPALALVPDAAGVTTIRTREPAFARTRIDVAWRLAPDGAARATVRLVDNGSSPAVAKARAVGTDERARALGEALATVLAGATVESCELRDPWHSASGEYELDFSVTVPDTTHRLAASILTVGPLTLAASLAGLPNGFAAPVRPKAEDAVTLDPPWDTRRNTTGLGVVVDATATFELPPGMSWTPPAPREESRPWLTFKREWRLLGSQTWAVSLHIEMQRGSWSDGERRERLTLMDELYSSLYAPHVATQVAATPP